MSDADERTALIHRGLSEAAEMIDGLGTPHAAALRTRLSELMRRMKAWEKTPPTRIEKASMVNSVLELNLDALKQRREFK